MGKYIDRVLHYFEELNKIPRASKHEEKVQAYLIDWAKKNGFYTYQDKIGNVVIRCNASEGYENAPTVTMQGHSDMVTEKTKDSNHDFLKDPIEHVIHGDILKANKTTLGADNGLAIAMAQVILEDKDLKHPALELLVTVDEETEMTGALELEENMLEGKYLLNIDSEDEGILTMGSAGGELLTITLDTKKEDFNGSKLDIEFSGFMGGHSGIMINEPKGNMIKVMGSFLSKLSKSCDLRLINFTSGTKDNSIPREGHLEIIVDKYNKEDVDKIIDSLREENKNIEGEVKVDVKVENTITLSALNKESTENVIYLVNTIETGVKAFEKADKNLVETSQNLAIIKTLENSIEIQISTRSSIKENTIAQREEAIKIAKNVNAKVVDSGAYPGWAYKEESKLRDVALKTYKEITGKDMDKVIIHAGLECGAIIEKYPNMDAISIGPDIKDAHTPDENMSISSCERVFMHIVKILENMK